MLHFFLTVSAVSLAQTSTAAAHACVEAAVQISQKNAPDSVELSDVLMDIGDVSLESSNAKQALEDYAKCLQIRKSLLPESDRRIAEVYYVMGLALSMLPECQAKAKEHFDLAKASMSARIEQLDPTSSAAEIDELKELIADVDRHVCGGHMNTCTRGNKHEQTQTQQTD